VVNVMAEENIQSNEGHGAEAGGQRQPATGTSAAAAGSVGGAAAPAAAKPAAPAPAKKKEVPPAPPTETRPGVEPVDPDLQIPRLRPARVLGATVLLVVFTIVFAAVGEWFIRSVLSGTQQPAVSAVTPNR